MGYFTKIFEQKEDFFLSKSNRRYIGLSLISNSHFEFEHFDKKKVWTDESKDLPIDLRIHLNINIFLLQSNLMTLKRSSQLENCGKCPVYFAIFSWMSTVFY